VIYRQQEEIDQLNAKLRVVSERLEHVESPDKDEAEPEVEVPPHY
jgi:uncharacterized coiled-coil protein SlyX